MPSPPHHLCSKPIKIGVEYVNTYLQLNHSAKSAIRLTHWLVYCARLWTVAADGQDHACFCSTLQRVSALQRDKDDSSCCQQQWQTLRFYPFKRKDRQYLTSASNRSGELERGSWEHRRWKLCQEVIKDTRRKWDFRNTTVQNKINHFCVLI